VDSSIFVVENQEKMMKIVTAALTVNLKFQSQISIVSFANLN
jgi:hypothetical protein